jgi:hypothetical protein
VEAERVAPEWGFVGGVRWGRGRGMAAPWNPSPLTLAPHEGKRKIRLGRWKGKVLIVLGGPLVSANIRPSGGGERAGETMTTKVWS